MIKKIIIASSFLLMFSCSNDKPVINNSDQLDASPKITYDTMAIDSFGPGATSEAVMAKINAVAIKREKDSLAKIAKAEQEKLDKEKAKLEAEKAKEVKKEIKTEVKSEPTTNP